MINFINLIRQDDISFSDDIGKIDINNSIIICSRKDEQNLIYDNLNKITFITNDNIPFTNYTTVNDFTVFEYGLRCKICYPKHIDINFVTPFGISYYNQIYTTFNSIINANNVVLENIRHIIYLDRVIFRMQKRPLSIKQNDHIITMDIKYSINCQQSLANIYYIRDNFIFESFMDHFDR